MTRRWRKFNGRKPTQQRALAEGQRALVQAEVLKQRQHLQGEWQRQLQEAMRSLQEQFKQMQNLHVVLHQDGEIIALSQGREAFMGSSFLVERARLATNPARPMGFIGASDPPQTIMSALPMRISSAADKIA